MEVASGQRVGRRPSPRWADGPWLIFERGPVALERRGGLKTEIAEALYEGLCKLAPLTPSNEDERKKAEEEKKKAEADELKKKADS